MKKKTADRKRFSRQLKDCPIDRPFEVKKTKNKRHILGTKTKNGRFAGYTNSKLALKRKDRLNTMIEQRTKRNKIVDHRLGEYDQSLSAEDKMIQRFAVEKKKHHEKAEAYQLEDYQLTHLGQSLAEVENFQEDEKFSSDEDNDNAQDDSDLYFGGFLKKKSESQSESTNQPKSKKEIMDEIIAKSKQRKYERKREKERTENMMLNIDEEWKEMMPVLIQSSINAANTTRQENKVDSYDKSVRELAFDLKAKATSRLKSEEELIKEEKEKLEQLEADRLRRMKGLPDTSEKRPKHLSADAMETNIEEIRDKRIALRYMDGKAVIPEGYTEEELLPRSKATTVDDNELSDQEDASDDDNDQNSDEAESAEEEGSEEEEISEEDSDSLEDLNSDEDVNSPQESENEDSAEEMNKQEEKNTVSLEMKAAAEELPYQFKAPASYNEFKSLVTKRSLQDQLTIIDRLRTHYHISLDSKNRGKLEVLLDCLLHHLENITQEFTEQMLNSNVLDGLIKHIFSLAQVSPQYTANCCLLFLNKYVNETKKKGKAAFPGIHQLIFFRVMAIIFPTTDYHHCISTPTMLYMGKLLIESNVESLTDITKGLFICNNILDYVSKSKRFVPEVVIFLTDIISAFSTFKDRKYENLLHIENLESAKIQPIQLHWLNSTTFSDISIDTLRLSLLALAIDLLDQFAKLYANAVAFPEIYHRTSEILNCIDIEGYPAEIKANYESIQMKISSTISEPRNYLILQKRKPQPLKLLEPRFEDRTQTNSERSYGNKKHLEKMKDRRQNKRDQKRLTRELRRDSRYVAMKQREDRRMRDTERKRKVKEIEHLLSNQQAEMKAYKKRK
ncbi:Nucleolar protein 14 [Trichoplax sp. H2]|nr:Nucleolar protein 14 [Trichoplax sp. H2]|eukprot:RDD40549.1 Nucleolar protein 14 [Trichoplax sp. H2]